MNKKSKKEIVKESEEVSLTAKDMTVKIPLDKEKSKKLTGFESYGNELILHSTFRAIGPNLSEEQMDRKGRQILSSMNELQPRDGFEGMMISQMITVYIQAMSCFESANSSQLLEYKEKNINQGVKLMRLYNQQLEALDKHRNKGKQKMTVEHVHVYKGGKAIVGDVHQGGGVKHEK